MDQITDSRHQPNPIMNTTINGFDVHALRETIQTIDNSPELGEASFRSVSEWQEDRRVLSSIRTFTAAGADHDRPDAHELSTDLPTALLGTDRGPSPLELALTALTSCVTTTIVAHASARGIELDALRVQAVGNLDLRGFLDLSKDVRKGYRRLRLEVSIRGGLEQMELEEFVNSAVRFSPVLDLFQNGAAVEIDLV